MAGPQEQNLYARDDIAARYDGSRALPPDVERDWSQRIVHRAGTRPAVSADVGCGTGRFTRILWSAFGGRVVGIDPSLPMLRRAAHSLADCPGVVLVQGRAEALPLPPASVDVVLMSMSFHHVPDQPAALASVRGVLREDGLFFVRTCTRNALGSYLYQRFFPEARALDERRFPARGPLIRQIVGAGFRIRTAETVRERVADDLRQYRDSIASRTHSVLQSIDDDAFRAGMTRLDAWCAARDPARPVFHDVDLFTFSAS